MSPNQKNAWIMTINRLDELTNSYPLVDFPLLAERLGEVLDEARREFADLLLDEVMEQSDG